MIVQPIITSQPANINGQITSLKTVITLFSSALHRCQNWPHSHNWLEPFGEQRLENGVRNAPPKWAVVSWCWAINIWLGTPLEDSLQLIVMQVDQLNQKTFSCKKTRIRTTNRSNQPMNESISLYIYLSVNQPVSRSIKQWISRIINHQWLDI